VSVRPLRQSVRPSPIFLVLVGLTALGGAMAWMAAQETRPLAYAGVFLFVIAGWVVSLCLHEFGHAYTAWRFGDHDVAARGYLTLNPLKYSSPLLSLGLPLLFIALGGIGLPGGAVYIRTGLMTPRQRTLVSLAGPLANLVLAVLLLGAARLFYDPKHAVFWAAVAFLGFLQLTALVLNLLPLRKRFQFLRWKRHQLNQLLPLALQTLHKCGHKLLMPCVGSLKQCSNQRLCNQLTARKSCCVFLATHL
jgi:Zn-dependent protease